MTDFNIEIPTENFAAYKDHDLKFAGTIVNMLKSRCDSFARVEPTLSDTISYAGTGAPPLLVTLLAAIAQGHSLEPILDKPAKRWDKI